MAKAQLCGLQDEITCSVCLDILTDPVSLHCGHSFCLKCLNNYWDQSQECSCPQCRHTFTIRPELYINTVLNEVVKKSKKTGLGPLPSQSYVGPGDVECDACTEKKFRAVKSCLTCTASFCQTHLQPHFEIAAWKHHKLVDPDGNLKEKLCAKHQKCLEVFCKTDEICICAKCVVTEHNGHKMVELETEREEKQNELGATLSDINERLQEKEKTLKEKMRAMLQMNSSTESEVQKNEKSFTDLIYCIEEINRKVTERIREQEKRDTEKAEGVIEQLEMEIEELKKRHAELKELSDTKDHIHFLQTFSSLCVLPADGDSLSFTVTADFSSECLRKELSCLKKSLEKISQWGIVTFTPSGSEAPMFIIQPPEPQSRDEFLRYFCPLTLDINTAQRDLHLSEGNKKVTCERTQPEYPDHPDRFDYWEQVLCREALTGTRSYWEVECTGDWVLIGVAYKGLSRKGKDLECSFGSNNKSWSLLCADSQYAARHNDEETVISTPYSPRIGVYLDWPAGSLSFYSVSHTMTLLHRFNTSLTEPLYPGFGFWLDCKSSVKICHLTPCDH
ncbi:tripartite motif-containing protein 16-like isoform X2 [Erpetoichthys calabaricus]|uniref:tripartite motif-containing protein 16-like isoform X2 n=1 Tax=Erpetoichthys calabaricus TaxID=27687 RepID=UPI0022343ECA|nr:tripartite motif-containing protein 16-like isoform X2 [Erpetoichthys calabaricus]